MNILFLGGLFPLDREREIINNSKGIIQNAANNFQWSLVKGLDHYYKDMTILTSPFIGNFPFNYRTIAIKKSKFSHINEITDICIGFISLPLVSLISKYIVIKKELKRWSKNIDEKSCIIIYSIHSPFLKAAVKTKYRNPKIKICLIIPDLPQYMSENNNIIYRLFKRIDSILINRCLKQVDSYVLLSDYMVDKIGIDSQPYVRIEGIYSLKIDAGSVEKNKEKVILYTGTLDKRYGIMNLLDAFQQIKGEQYRLWICGDGNCKDDIIRRSLLDNRIKYWGQLPYEKVLEFQLKATVLVNPRTSEGEFTKYSFPSKTMEYIASGTPCVMHRLPGIPSEYYDYVFIAEKEDADGLKDAILEVCSKDQSELNEFGKCASQFILENKNPIVQVRKIYDMINNL